MTVTAPSNKPLWPLVCTSPYHICLTINSLGVEKCHIWKREDLTNASTRNIFGLAESFSSLLRCKFLTETKAIQSVYL